MIRAALIISFLALVSCHNGEEKPKWFDRQGDEIFWGLSLGMPMQAFYDTCSVRNLDQIFQNGGAHYSVWYETEDAPFRHPTLISFYPKFSDKKIESFPIAIEYKAWAPWNEDYDISYLIKDVSLFIKQWYPDGSWDMTMEDGKEIAIYTTPSYKLTMYPNVDGKTVFVEIKRKM